MGVERNVDNEGLTVFVIDVDCYAEYEVDFAFVVAVPSEPDVVLAVDILQRGNRYVPVERLVSVECTVGCSNEEGRTGEWVDDDEVVILVLTVSGMTK